MMSRAVTSAANLAGMAFDDLGNLFIVDTTNDLLLGVDKSNGAIITAVGLGFNLGSHAGMDFHPDTGELLLADGGGGTNVLYTVDPLTGVMTPIGPTTGATNGLSGLEFVPGTPPPPPPVGFDLLGIEFVNPGTLYDVDPATGATRISATADGTSTSPTVRALTPWTNCRWNGMRKRIDEAAMNRASEPAVPNAMAVSRNRRNLSIG